MNHSHEKNSVLKIAVIGAGSGFTLSLLRGIYRERLKFKKIHIALHDINEEALVSVEKFIERYSSYITGQVTCSFHSTRKEALQGSHHVLASFAIGFPDVFLNSCWVMKNHGIDFVEGETATPGSLMATLRHLPLLMEISREIQEICPEAWFHVINNPMPRLVKGLIERSRHQRVVGHCHGTMYIKEIISQVTETPFDEIDVFVAGINHFHLVQKAVHLPTGTNLLEKIQRDPVSNQRLKRKDFTMWQMQEDLGYLFGHGIWHNYDYLPYANRRLFRHEHTNTWDRMNVMILGKRKSATGFASDLKTDQELADFLEQPDFENIFTVMLSLSGITEKYYYLSGNMPNRGHFPQLPDGSIVEIPAWVDSQGVHLEQVKTPVPEFFAAWLRLHLSIHERTVYATLNQSREAAIESIVLDPCFRNCDCSPAQLLKELEEVNKGLIPDLK